MKPAELTRRGLHFQPENKLREKYFLLTRVRSRLQLAREFEEIVHIKYNHSAYCGDYQPEEGDVLAGWQEATCVECLKLLENSLEKSWLDKAGDKNEKGSM